MAVGPDDRHENCDASGLPFTSLGGFGFIGVASDLSIAAAWQVGSGSIMSALGRQPPLVILPPQRQLSRAKQTRQKNFR